jgi:Ni/Co efflux regulator RcnB
MTNPATMLAVAFSLLLVPAAASAQQHLSLQRGPVQVQKQVVKKQVVVKQRWARGRALPANYRRNVVSDYRRYKLQRPGPGQRWVRVDNQYLLINSVSGMIAALVAAR